MFADVAVWWLSAQLIGALALPLTVWFFRRLPERGYSFARPFGLLLTGYGAWLLSMLGLGAFGRGLLLLVGLLLLACGVMLLGRNGLRRAAERVARPAAVAGAGRERCLRLACSPACGCAGTISSDVAWR